jgi:sulfur-oxidizing protein SoxB
MLLESNQKYVVGGWGSVNQNVKGPAIYNLLENFILEKKVIKVSSRETVKIVGM